MNVNLHPAWMEQPAMNLLSLVNSSVLALHFILEKNASITIIHVMLPTIHVETMLLVWPRLMGSRYASVKKVTYENAACLVHFTIVHSRVNYSETLSVKFKPTNLWMVKEEHSLQQLNNIAKLWPIFIGHIPAMNWKREWLKMKGGSCRQST